ncbi:tetratricopeptide repeat protein [Sphingomonas sp. EC-HK361]|uniref:tetratricopeptide repeat protein n=1 Tax=Sphingomonas sp. EC-HK361 TaxID=2038397 RepID=UPI001F2D2D59|nr:tetratricopeptide repeat protein [Sphingomonas sp. EC-HK361]
MPSARALRLGLVALVSLALVAAIVHLARKAERLDPETALALSGKLLAAGNYNAARAQAQSAIEQRPEMIAAYVALARAYVRLGEGASAEGAVMRARATGASPASTAGLLAEAARLQGDSDRALAEAGKAPAGDVDAERARARALADQGDYPAALQRLTALSDRNPSDSRLWSDLGRVRLTAGDVGGAAAAAARAVALDGANLDALVLRGETARSQYGLTAALPWFRAALARDAYFHPALIAAAATLGDMGRYTEMLDATRRALAARPGSGEALYLQAVLAARAGKWDLAQAMLDKTGGEEDDVPGVMLLSGAIDYAQGRYEQAVARFRDLVARQPMNIEARRLAGAALLKSGDPKGALEVLRPIGLRGDADPYALSLIARAFTATGEPNWAARFFDRAALSGSVSSVPFGTDDDASVDAGQMAENPGDPAAAVGYIRALLEAGDEAGALARARAIASVSPGAPQAHLLVGDTLAAESRMAEAAQAYARAADLRFDLQTMLRLVDARSRSGDAAGAAQVLALYLSQNPKSVAARRMVGNLQLDTQDWDAAIPTFEGLRRDLGARDAALLASLARAYAGAGHATIAMTYGRAAYALAPMNPAVVDAYGWAAYQADRPREALQLLRKAATIAPRDPSIRWHEAQVLADARRDAKARIAIDVALADPRFADRAAAVALRAALR